MQEALHLASIASNPRNPMSLYTVRGTRTRAHKATRVKIAEQEQQKGAEIVEWYAEALQTSEKDPGSRALDILKPFQGFVGGPEQYTVTVIKVKGDEDMYEFFNNRVWRCF